MKERNSLGRFESIGNQETKTVTFRLTLDDVARLTEIAKTKGMTRSDFIREAIKQAS